MCIFILKKLNFSSWTCPSSSLAFSKQAVAPLFIQLLKPKAIFDSSLTTFTQSICQPFITCLESSHLCCLNHHGIPLYHLSQSIVVALAPVLPTVCRAAREIFSCCPLQRIQTAHCDLWNPVFAPCLSASPSHYQSSLCSSLTTLICLFFQHYKLITTSRTLLFTVPGAQNSIAQTSSGLLFHIISKFFDQMS